METPRYLQSSVLNKLNIMKKYNEYNEEMTFTTVQAFIYQFTFMQTLLHPVYKCPNL